MSAYKPTKRALEIVSNVVDPEDIAPTGNENVELLRDVLTYAAKEKAIEARLGVSSPFNMNIWFNGDTAPRKKHAPRKVRPACGTSACLAGTAALWSLPAGHYLSGISVVKKGATFDTCVGHVSDLGRESLGLTYRQANALFYRTGERLDELRILASFITGVDLRDAGKAEAKAIRKAPIAEVRKLAKRKLA